MKILETLLDQARQRRGLPPPPIRRALREQAGLSQGDVARVLRVDRASVSRWESGDREPRRRFVSAYAALLDQLARPASEGTATR
jgi:transcriptional regulator with XRE-family HTH domain